VLNAGEHCSFTSKLLYNTAFMGAIGMVIGTAKGLYSEVLAPSPDLVFILICSQRLEEKKKHTSPTPISSLDVSTVAKLLEAPGNIFHLFPDLYILSLRTRRLTDECFA
jgi:hypothetical protein